MNAPRRHNLSAAARAELLRRCRPADFDGHTRFASLTAEQRLDWLEEAARFLIEFKGAARPTRLRQSVVGARARLPDAQDC
jgi:hypothetical protein